MCQTEIAKRIQEKKTDYVLAVKGNQGVPRTIGEKRTTETRYYISSLPMDAKQFGQAVRAYGSAVNFSMMHRISLSLVK